MADAEKQRARLVIEVEPFSPQLGADITGSTTVTFGEWSEGPYGTRLCLQAPMMRRSFSRGVLGQDVPMEVLKVLLDIPKDVAVALLVKWICEKFGRSATRVRINRTEVELSEGGVSRIVHEVIDSREE
jgi:hypothetical protein